MNIEDLQALVEKRRSTRGYDEDRAVSDDRVRTILECARWRPRWGNGPTLPPPRRGEWRAALDAKTRRSEDPESPSESTPGIRSDG